jgi:hypothetical protein
VNSVPSYEKRDYRKKGVLCTAWSLLTWLYRQLNGFALGIALISGDGQQPGNSHDAHCISAISH